MSVRKSSHGTIFLIVASGSPRALIASSLRSTSKKPFCPMTRSLHPPMTACGHRVRFVATWREEFFEVPNCDHLIRGLRYDVGRAPVPIGHSQLVCPFHSVGNAFYISLQLQATRRSPVAGVRRRGSVDHAELPLHEQIVGSPPNFGNPLHPII